MVHQNNPFHASGSEVILDLRSVKADSGINGDLPTRPTSDASVLKECRSKTLHEPGADREDQLQHLRSVAGYYRTLDEATLHCD